MKFAKKEIEEALQFGPETPDLIHPENKSLLASRKHVLGKNPAFPEHRQAPHDNFEEMLASSQWQKVCNKIQRYFGFRPANMRDIARTQQKLMQSLEFLNRAEASHRPQLEKLAIDIVFELPEFAHWKKAYENGEFGIKAKLVSSPQEIDLSDLKLADAAEPQTDAELPPPEEGENSEQREAEADLRQRLKSQVARRHFSNAITQGAAVSNNYAFEMAGSELDAIAPGLRQAYGILMVSSELGYWIFPQAAVAQALEQEMKLGSVRVKSVEEAPEGEERMEVQASGVHLPVLIQEIIKGLMELAAMHGLPEDEYERKAVMDQADLAEAEAWQMMLGPQLWDNFVRAVDSEDQRDVALHLYAHVQRMPDAQFNAFMRGVMGRDPEAMREMRVLARQVRGEMEA